MVSGTSFKSLTATQKNSMLGVRFKCLLAQVAQAALRRPGCLKHELPLSQEVGTSKVYSECSGSPFSWLEGFGAAILNWPYGKMGLVFGSAIPKAQDGLNFPYYTGRARIRKRIKNQVASYGTLPKAGDIGNNHSWKTPWGRWLHR